mmetsp:Transcript_2420/g.7283  ORF Transcript_2420/g.7283 Transcript_2420/m.7283 type:complete len:212 (-) Transcript_2420:19-654(-)
MLCTEERRLTPPTVREPLITVSICKVSVGAKSLHWAACVTLSGVGTVDTLVLPVERTTLAAVFSYFQLHNDSSLPRQALTSSKTCVVVLCSRYSCREVHCPSRVALWLAGHVLPAVQRQHVGDGFSCRRGPASIPDALTSASAPIVAPCTALVVSNAASRCLRSAFSAESLSMREVSAASSDRVTNCSGGVSGFPDAAVTFETTASSDRTA